MKSFLSPGNCVNSELTSPTILLHYPSESTEALAPPLAFFSNDASRSLTISAGPISGVLAIVSSILSLAIYIRIFELVVLAISVDKKLPIEMSRSNAFKCDTNFYNPCCSSFNVSRNISTS